MMIISLCPLHTSSTQYGINTDNKVSKGGRFRLQLRIGIRSTLLIPVEGNYVTLSIFLLPLLH